MITDERRVALITGASSGIGAAFARKLSSQGYDLILVARRKEKLKQLATELQTQFRVDTEVLIADLSEPVDLARVEKHIAELTNLELVVNNAGFGVPGKFVEAQLDKTMAMIDVHIIASTRLAHAVLPAMIKRSKGVIINVASIGGFIPRPQDAVYCASKAYLIAFSQALQGELTDTGIQVQVLCPGFVPTEFLDSPEYQQLGMKNKIPKWLWSPAEAVVQASLRALNRDQVVCIPGFKNRVIVTLGRSGLATTLLKILANKLRDSSRIPVSSQPLKKESTS